MDPNKNLNTQNKPKSVIIDAVRKLVRLRRDYKLKQAKIRKNKSYNQKLARKVNR